MTKGVSTKKRPSPDEKSLLFSHKFKKNCLKVVRSTFLPSFETEHDVVMCRSHTITPVQAYTGKILKA